MIQEISGMLSGLKTDLNMTQATQFLSDMLSKVRDWCKNITENIRDFIQSSLRKPTKKEDYVKLGSKYISKKMVLLGGVLIVAGVFATATYVYPWADGRIWRTSLEYGSEKYKTFSGMARIHSNGKTIYIGDMKEGQLSG